MLNNRAGSVQHVDCDEPTLQFKCDRATDGIRSNLFLSSHISVLGLMPMQLNKPN
jgi:hypothetical protein